MNRTSKSTTSNRYKELKDMANVSKQRLLDALSLYKLFTEVDVVEQWIAHREKMLDIMVPVPSKDIAECKIMQSRFNDFVKEMSANASRYEKPMVL